MKSFILKHAPVLVQNLAISIFNTHQYRVRHGGAYRRYCAYFSGADLLGREEVAAEQAKRLDRFLRHASEKSAWYASYQGQPLHEFPILEKRDLVESLDEICTIPERTGLVSYTGGTTGASLKVVYTKEDMQERFAALDHFRAKYGYVLGRRTAWFSGKSLVRKKDLARGICYRDDYIGNIRFFSTFHISEENFQSYWNALVGFRPDFIVGFPSSVYDICSMALEKGLRMPTKGMVFFPTAEPVLPHQAEVLRRVLGCRIVEQYASSEGAPFILECTAGRLHIHPLTGIFEVVDEAMQPALEGEVLVTSFSTRGTPLVRYRIGDRIRLFGGDEPCACGSVFPLVDKIFGRDSDFVWSPENGRVNLGNLSNCTKGIAGVVCFQIIQHQVDAIAVNVVPTPEFDSVQEADFLRSIRERVGDSMEVEVRKVERIERESSGKFRFVRNLVPSESMRAASSRES